MPTYRKKTYRKKTRRYPRKRSKTVGFTRNMTSYGSNAPLQKTLKATMLYTDDVVKNLVSSAANPGTTVYSLNGLYDIDITGTGMQPRAFDQMMLLYEHYTVIGVKVRLDFSNNNATKPAYCIATLRAGSTTSTNHRDYMEEKNSNWKLLGIEASQSVTSINLRLNPNKFLGRSKPMADPELKGGSGQNPTEQCYLHVSAVSQDLFNASSVNVIASFEFTTIFSEPRDVASS